MNQILKTREIILSFYKKFEFWIQLCFKFIMGIIIFTFINKLGYTNIFDSFPMFMLMGILSMVLSLPMITFFMIIIICIHLFSVSLELAVIVGIILMCFLLFYIRIFPKESLLIFGILLAYYFKIPYIIIFIGAIIFGLSSIVPVSIGTFIWYFIPHVIKLAQMGGSTLKNIGGKDLLEIPSEFAKVYSYLLDTIKSDQVWIVSVVIFSLIIIVIYIISHLQIEYNNYLAIGVGSVMNMIGFMLAILVADIDISIFGVMISTLICGLTACVFEFFERVLDYSATEKVQFEDDDYYYYIKAVPKISAKSKKN